MIKAITFDLDGVYFIKGKAEFIKSLGVLGVPEAEAKRVFLESEEMRQYKRELLTDKEFWTWALKEWKLSMTIQEIIDVLVSGYEENPEVLDVVRKARANGYKTMVCSNNFPARINGLQQKFKFLDNFDVAVMAYDAGAMKPDKKIFEVLIRKANVSPSEIFMADDREDTIESARELGIEAFYYTNFNNFLLDLEKLGINLN